MKVKAIIFLILFPIFEGLAFLITYAIQVVYVIRMENLDVSFSSLFTSYLLNPGYAISECIHYKNPFLFIVPIGALILLIYFLFINRILAASEIDSKADIYGTANWESIQNLTRKNFGKRKFFTCSKKQFLDSFMESINEKK